MRNRHTSEARWQGSAGGSHSSLDRFGSAIDTMAVAQWDEYPSIADEPEDLSHVLDALEGLDDEHRLALERTVVAGMSLSEAAYDLGWFLSSGRPHKTRVMRARDRGLAVLRSSLDGVDAPTVPAQ